MPGRPKKWCLQLRLDAEGVVVKPSASGTLSACYCYWRSRCQCLGR